MPVGCSEDLQTGCLPQLPLRCDKGDLSAVRVAGLFMRGAVGGSNTFGSEMMETPLLCVLLVFGWLQNVQFVYTSMLWKKMLGVGRSEFQCEYA